MKARIQGSMSWDYVVEAVVFPVNPRALHLRKSGEACTLCWAAGSSVAVPANKHEIETLDECPKCQGFASTSNSGARTIRALLALEEVVVSA